MITIIAKCIQIAQNENSKNVRFSVPGEIIDGKQQPENCAIQIVATNIFDVGSNVPGKSYKITIEENV